MEPSHSNPPKSPSAARSAKRLRWILVGVAAVLTILVSMRRIEEDPGQVRAGEDRNLVILDSIQLVLGTERLCLVGLDPYSERLDYPESALDRENGQITVLREKLSARSEVKNDSYRLRVGAALPWRMVTPLLETMDNAGLAAVELRTSEDSAQVSLRRMEDVDFQSGMFLGLPDSGDYAWVFVVSDTFQLLVSRQEKIEVRTFVAKGEVFEPGPLARLAQGLSAWDTLLRSIDTVGVLVPPRDSFARVVRLARSVARGFGKSVWIAERSMGLERFLARNRDDQALTERWSIDSLSPSRGAYLTGLDRVFFRRVGVGGLLAMEALGAQPWLPLRSDTPLPPPCDEDCPVSGTFYHKDFPVPGNAPGRSLRLREVQLRDVTMKTWPVWWALYDNGVRTSVWTFQGGFVEDRILTNYRIEALLPLGKDGFRLCVRGESYRNGSWTEKGVELDFAWTERDFQLSKVGNRFGWFSGDVFKTEEPAPGGWTERTAENPPASLLRRCGYRDPTGEESPGFDWDRNLRISRCITAWSGAKTTFRPAGEPSFIER